MNPSIRCESNLASNLRAVESSSYKGLLVRRRISIHMGDAICNALLRFSTNYVPSTPTSTIVVPASVRLKSFHPGFSCALFPLVTDVYPTVLSYVNNPSHIAVVNIFLRSFPFHCHLFAYSVAISVAKFLSLHRPPLRAL